MVDERKITYEIEIDDSGVVKGFRDFEKDAKKVGKKSGDALSKGFDGSKLNSAAESLAKISENLNRTEKDAGMTTVELAGLGLSLAGIAATGEVTLGAMDAMTKQLGFWGNVVGTATAKAGSLNKALAVPGRGLFALTEHLTLTSAALLTIGSALKQSENEWTRYAGVVSTTLGIITGGLSAALTYMTIMIGKFANEIGTKLVNAFKSATETFLSFQKRTLVLEKTVENFNIISGDAVGTTESWTSAINGLSRELNLSRTKLSQSAAEIIAVGTQMGFTSEQMQKLTRVAAEYAKVNDKDVFKTTIAVVNALNGNTQAIQQYGVKLNQAALQQYAYKKGLTSSLSALSEQELAQLRYNKLLSQFTNISGIAQASANSLADQQNKWKVATEELNVSLGEGAAIIEGNNILVFGLNKILDTLNTTVIKVMGFFGALGARVLQIGGFFLEWSFKVFLVIKAIKLLNFVLGTNLMQTAFGASIPLINMSITQMIQKLGIATVDLRSFGGVMRTVFSAAKAQVFSLFTTFGALFKQMGGFVGIIKTGLVAAMGVLKVAVLTLSKALLALLAHPVVLVIAAIVAGLVALVKAISYINEKTGVFTDLWEMLMSSLSGASSIFQPLINWFGKVYDSIVKLASKGFGMLVFALSKVISGLMSLATKNPFGMFSKKTISNISAMQVKLAGLSDSLKNVAFDFTKLQNDADRGLAGKNHEQIKINMEQLSQLRESYAQTELERLETQNTERLALINNALQAQLLSETEANSIRENMLVEYAERRKQILGEMASATIKDGLKIANFFKNSFARGISNSIQTVVGAIMAGKDAFGAFAQFVLGFMGDMAIKLGEMFILKGIAIESMKSLSGGTAIAAGTALVALGTVMKTFAGGAGATADAGGGFAGGGISVDGTDTYVDPSDTEERQTGQQVVVNVEGNVIDTKRTFGLEVAEALKEAFEEDGVIAIGVNA